MSSIPRIAPKNAPLRGEYSSPSVRIRHIRADPWSIPAIQGEARLRQAMAGYVFKDHGAGR